MDKLTRSVLVTFAIVWGGCAASRAAPPPGEPDGTAGAPGAVDDEPPTPVANTGPSAPPPEDPPPPLGDGLQDRCLEGNCDGATLPDQPAVPFLEDAGDGWLRLIQADWELAGGSEGYRCVRKTIPEDVYITAFKPLSPTGTHHTVMVVNSNAPEPDGVTVCGVLAQGERRLQGAGTGTEPSVLPDGVAMKVLAGEQILMNLHLFNFDSAPLSGTSGMLVKTVEPGEVEHEAGTILAGPLGLTIPPGRVMQTGGCTLSSPTTIFAVGPHMHQLGAHMRVTAHSSIVGDQMIHDGAYDFTHQLLYPVDDVPMAAGDRVSLECTYDNDTDRVVGWGDSTLDEMCFVGLGIYPITGDASFPCTG